MKSITDEQKIYELSRIWKEAAYNFAFWDRVDIDWDEEYKKALGRVLKTKDINEYYLELMRFYALLGDGHTEVSMPMKVLQDPEYFSMLPVFLWKFGERTVVLTVAEELKESLPVMSELKKVEGAQVNEYIRENCYPYIWHSNEAACGPAALNLIMYGRRGSSITLTFEKDGAEYEHTLVRGDPAKMSWYNGGSFRICTRRCLAQNGEDIYNKGFAPDITISQTPEDYAAGRDRAMEKGIEIIKDRIKGR